MCELFLKLGNTGAAAQRRWLASTSIVSLPEGDEGKKAAEGMNETIDLVKLLRMRHPDPKFSAKLELQNPDLQVRGSWAKIEIPKEKSIQPRCGFASFVWNGE